MKAVPPEPTQSHSLSDERGPSTVAENGQIMLCPSIESQATVDRRPEVFQCTVTG